LKYAECYKRKNMLESKQNKKSGVLMPIFSLPSNYGIGTLGEEAYRFIDVLVKSRQNFWQVLPLNPTSYGDSPYQSPSAFAGNPYFIDLDFLCKDGLLTEKECRAERTRGQYIDYARLYRRRIPVLRKAYGRFKKSKAFDAFLQTNSDWLCGYSKFMALKEQNDQKVWNEWTQTAEPEPAEQEFWQFIQFVFFRQWNALKAYANEHGIQMIGDMPIYVAYDSADVWQNRLNFNLDDKGNPSEVAGVPPDAFSETGQLWGNPIYNWAYMKQNGYEWWHRRMKHALNMFDWVRIDHFIGFIRYYCIPADETDARVGEWRKGPGVDLFKGFEKENIIAEDLGLLTDEVREAISLTGYPGMKILQHAFGGDTDCEHKPSNFSQNNVVYTGTHDNETLYQRISATKRKNRKTLIEDLKRECGLVGIRPRYFTSKQICKSILSLLFRSNARIVVVPVSDLLLIGNKGRINAPSTLGNNWRWRCRPRYRLFQKRLLSLTKLRETTQIKTD